MEIHSKRKTFEYQDSESSQDGARPSRKVQFNSVNFSRNHTFDGLKEDSDARKMKITVKPLFKNDQEEGRFKVISEIVDTYNLPTSNKT